VVLCCSHWVYQQQVVLCCDHWVYQQQGWWCCAVTTGFTSSKVGGAVL